MKSTVPFIKAIFQSFKIPKKDDDGGTVDKAKIQAFLARKEKEKKEEEKRKIAEKEKLAQLRLQANNGKVGLFKINI